MPGVALDDPTKARVRHHLGYPNVTVAGVLVAGTVLSSQPAFLVERAMNNVLDTAVNLVLTMLTTLDKIEAQMVDALSRLQAAKADVVTLNPNEHSMLLDQYALWQRKLANELNVDPNPYQPISNGLNVRVM